VPCAAARPVLDRGDLGGGSRSSPRKEASSSGQGGLALVGFKTIIRARDRGTTMVGAWEAVVPFRRLAGRPRVDGPASS